LKADAGTNLKWWQIDPASLPADSAMRVMLSFTGRPGTSPGPLDFKIHDRTEIASTYTRMRVSYVSEPGERVPAYLLVPHKRAAARVSGIVSLHQHNTQFYLGKSEVVGLVGHPMQPHAHEMAMRGHVVIAADAPIFEERAPDLPYPKNEEWADEHFAARGWSMGGKAIWDIGRAIDVLQSLDYVDPERIGVVGHSMGGWMAIWSMSIEPRIKAGVACCGFEPLDGAGHYLPRPRHVPPEVGLSRTRILTDLICPRPILVISTTLERPPIEFRREVEAARPAYEAAGASDDLELWIPQGRHRFLDEVRPRAYAWLERRLG
jgi:dienelactone hydrolase